MFWSLRRFLSRITRPMRYRIRWLPEYAADARWYMRSHLARLHPRQFVSVLAYYVATVVFGHRRRQFVLTSMAIFLIGCCTVGLGCGAVAVRDRLVEHYVSQATVATSGGDHRLALDFWQWIVWLDGSRSDHRLRLVEAYDRAGVIAQGDALLAELAPDDRHGYPPAYALMIRRDARSDDLSPERLGNMLRELDWLSKYELDPRELDELRIACLLRMGRLSDARELLDRPSRIGPSIRMSAARTFASLDMRKAALTQAGFARQDLIKRLAEYETVADRLLLAEAEGIMGNLRGVEENLRTGATLYPQGAFTVELARFYLQMSTNGALTSEQKNAMLVGGLRLMARVPADTPERSVVLWRLYLARRHGSRQQ